MSTPPYRPSALLLIAWVGLYGLVGAGSGLTIAWYGGLWWVLASVTPQQRAPGSLPPDVLAALRTWLWTEGLVPAVLLGAVVGAALAVLRAAIGERYPQRWRNRAWQLGGVSLGALVGVPVGVLLVGAWSILTLRLDPERPPPSVTTQSIDVMIFGLLYATPFACSLIGRWLGAVQEGRASGREAPQEQVRDGES